MLCLFLCHCFFLVVVFFFVFVFSLVFVLFIVFLVIPALSLRKELGVWTLGGRGGGFGEVGEYVDLAHKHSVVHDM